MVSTEKKPKASDVGDVVRDGLTQPLYASAGSSAEEAKIKRLQIPKAELATSFFFTLNSDQVQRYGDPIVSADSNTELPIAFPELAGSLLEHNVINGTQFSAVRAARDRTRGSAGRGSNRVSLRQPTPTPTATPSEPPAPLELIVKFNCERKGTSAVLIKIPLLPSGDIHFTVRKECDDNPNTVEATRAAAEAKKKLDKASDKKAADAAEESDSESDDDDPPKTPESIELNVAKKIVVDSDRVWPSRPVPSLLCIGASDPVLCRVSCRLSCAVDRKITRLKVVTYGLV